MATKYQGENHRIQLERRLGDQGGQGDPGERGDQGVQGIQGVQGVQGISGGGNGNSWHLERRITIGVIFAIIAIAVNGIWAVVDIRQNLALLSQKQEADSRILHEQDNKASDAMREGLGIVRSQYDQLSLKLDRLIERDRK